MLIILSVAVTILILASVLLAGFVIHKLDKRLDKLDAFLMAERDPVAYQAAQPEKKQTQAERIVEKEKKEEAALMTEWRKIQSKGVASNEDIKKFGEREGVIS